MKIKSIDTSKEFKLNDSIFKVEMNDQVVYQSVVAELNNLRQGTVLQKIDPQFLEEVKNHSDKKELVMPDRVQVDHH